MLRSADALLRITAIVLLLSGTATSQSKVGSEAGTGFLDLPTSTRSAGMANIAVMLREGDSYFYNPAVLGIPSERGRWHLPFNVIPDLTGSGAAWYTGGVVMRPRTASGSRVTTVGVALDMVYFVSDPLEEYTYSNGPGYPDGSLYGDGRTFRWKDTRIGLNIGVGWKGRVDFGLGVAVNWIGEYVLDYDATSWSADVGAYLAVPLSATDRVATVTHRLSLGASYSNLGPDIEFVEQTAPLDKPLRFGAALECNWFVNGRKRLELLPAIEYEVNTTDDQSTTKLGLEFTYREFVSVRGGYQTAERMVLDHHSYGFSLSTLGLRPREMSPEPSGTGFFRSLVDAVVIDLHYAYNPAREGFLDGTNYFGLGLTF